MPAGASFEVRYTHDIKNRVRLMRTVVVGEFPMLHGGGLRLPRAGQLFGPSHAARIYLSSLKVFAVNCTRRTSPQRRHENLRSRACALSRSSQMGVVMQHHLKQSAQRVRLAEVVDRPLTPLRALWQGPPPLGVDAILTRDALAKDFRDGYVSWATNFALLSSDWLAGIQQREVAKIKAQFASQVWRHYPTCDLYNCDVGDDAFWIVKQDAGWTIELGWESKGNLRILTIAGMPALCPGPISAMRLALASYPNAIADLTWHSYW